MSTTVDQAVERQLREVMLPATRRLLTTGFAVPRPNTPDHVLTTVSQLDQLEAFIAADISIFERACSQISSAPLDDAHRQSEYLKAWQFGVPLIDWVSTWNWGTSLPDIGGRVADLFPRHYSFLKSVGPRYLAAMTQLATAWLSPRFAGEPRTATRQRIPSLKPVDQSLRLQELMGKNTEETLTPDERGEFERLHEFFETLQDIIDAALYPPSARS